MNLLSFTEIQSDLFNSLKGLYSRDGFFGRIWNIVQAGTTPISVSLREYSIRNGLLFRKGKVCVPDVDDTRTRIMFECHDTPSAGHPGVLRTEHLVRRDFFWPKLKADVEQYVRNCQQCQVNKAERLRRGGLLLPLEIPEKKWQSISMDFVVGLPRTRRGDNAIWVVVDRLTKMARFIPTRDSISAVQLAHLFVEKLFSLYGLPVDIVSDRDPKFTGHFWREVFKKLDTRLSMSSADHPESDGQTERVNQTMEDMLRAYVSLRQSDWEEYLPLVEFTYNSAKHSATRMSPFMLLYDFQPRAPWMIGLERVRVGAAVDFLKQQQEMLEFARESIKCAQDRAQFYANQNRSPRVLEEGQMVYLRIPKDSQVMRTGKVYKLSPRDLQVLI